LKIKIKGAFYEGSEEELGRLVREGLGRSGTFVTSTTMFLNL